MLRQKPDEVIKSHPNSILWIDVSFAGYEGFKVTRSLSEPTSCSKHHWSMNTLSNDMDVEKENVKTYRGLLQ